MTAKIEVIKTEVHFCDPTVLKRIVRMRKEDSANPTLSRIKEYPRREATTMITFFKLTSAQILGCCRFLFLKIRSKDLLKTIREQMIRPTPRRKGKRPAPGLTKLPSFKFKERKETPKPNNIQTIPGIQSFSFNGEFSPFRTIQIVGFLTRCCLSGPIFIFLLA
jgi:hypothetical protein